MTFDEFLDAEIGVGEYAVHTLRGIIDGYVLEFGPWRPYSSCDDEIKHIVGTLKEKWPTN